MYFMTILFSGIYTLSAFEMFKIVYIMSMVMEANDDPKFHSPEIDFTLKLNYLYHLQSTTRIKNIFVIMSIEFLRQINSSVDVTLTERLRMSNRMKMNGNEKKSNLSLSTMSPLHFESHQPRRQFRRHHLSLIMQQQQHKHQWN